MWVPGETTVLRDAKGFVLTGRDLLANARWWCHSLTNTWH